jgi:hypothetical protein
MAENTCGWRKILADGKKYLWMAENTCGWQKILADGGEYLRMAENTCGWQKILADSKKHSRITTTNQLFWKRTLFRVLSYIIVALLMELIFFEKAECGGCPSTGNSWRFGNEAR